MVVDGDALNILAQQNNWPMSFRAQAVLTPEPMELARLLRFTGQPYVPNDDEGRIEVARAAAQFFDQVVVLKGHRTVVSDGTQTYLNHTGNSSLAKSGTGDVLSGMIGTLLAQKVPRFQAACLAVHLHGMAGEMAGRKMGDRSVLIPEVIEMISSAILQFERQRQPTPSNPQSMTERTGSMDL
jgi:NAD(P)H-hydrate epimerase